MDTEIREITLAIEGQSLYYNGIAGLAYGEGVECNHVQTERRCMEWRTQPGLEICVRWEEVEVETHPRRGR